MAENKSRDYLTVDEISNMGGDGAELPVIDPEDVAAIFRTSGSTGNSKANPPQSLCNTDNGVVLRPWIWIIK